MVKLLLLCLLPICGYTQTVLDSLPAARETRTASTTTKQSPHTTVSLYKTGYDTIWVSDPNRNVKIKVDASETTPVADIGNKHFASRILGCCDIILKSLTTTGTPGSLYISAGELVYNGTIAYRADMPLQDEVIDWRTPKATVSAPSTATVPTLVVDTLATLEMKRIARAIGVVEGRSRDRFHGIADMNERLVFKFADLMKDDRYYYFKFKLINESRVDFKIELLDFVYRNSKDVNEYRLAEPKENNGTREVRALESGTLVYILPLYTLTSKWELSVTLREKEGSRKLHVIIPWDIIDKAEKL
jgi:hypothetical protein